MSDDIWAGREFLNEISKYIPVKAAFWLKEVEDEPWYLFITSDRIGPEQVPEGYAKVMEAAEHVTHPLFDPFRVKVVPPNDRFAQAAIEMYRRDPTSRAMHLGGTIFGGQGVEGLFLYPDPSAAPTP